MKFLIALLVLMNVAYAQTCITTGDCPRELTPGIGCLVVKTGTDPMGNVTCVKQCFQVQLSYVCKRHQCVLEKAPDVAFDPNSANACRRAIDP